MNAKNYFSDTPQVFIKQVKEWGEILFNFETKNRYQLLDARGTVLGKATEQGSGLLCLMKRFFCDLEGLCVFM